MSGKSRIQNSVKNVSYGLIVAVLNTVASFVSRTILVKTLGLEILGINGLFTEVIAMLSLAELGVGMAIIYSLYKPIHNNDYSQISKLMSLYKSAYTTIAGVTLVLGIGLTPFIHNLISDINYPLRYIQLIFSLFVVRTASTYFFSYKTALLNADQKQYIVSLTTAIIKLIFTGIIVFVLIISHNYVVYLVMLIIQNLVTNFILSLYVDKKYPWIDYKEKLTRSERNKVFSDIKNIFIKRISGVITSSTDNVLISTLVSTLQVGLYSNYVLLFSVIRTLKQQFTNGIAASIGNLSISSEVQHCVVVLKRLTFLYFLFGIIMASGLMAVSGTFIAIWLGKEFVMPYSIINVAIFNLYFEICCEPLWQYLETSGLFKSDKNIAIIGSTINLIISIVLGIKIGISGILVGTVCTQVVQMILKARLIFQKNFHISPWSYFALWIRMILAYMALIFIQYFLIGNIIIENIYIEFLAKGSIAVGVAIVLVILFFAKTDEYSYSKRLFIALIGKSSY